MSDTVLSDRPADASTAVGTQRRVLQRVVLPTSRDTDVLPLYVDPDRPQLDVNTNGMTAKQRGRIPPAMPNAETQPDPHAVTGRRGYRVEPNDRVSFGTYFNAFPASYWRRWTVVDDVRLEVTVTGAGSRVTVYRSMPDGRAQRVQDQQTTGEGAQSFVFDLSLATFADGGWYWFDLIAGDQGLHLDEASWTAEVPADRVEPGTVTIGITTMNRPAFCADLLRQIGEDDDVRGVLDEVVLAEQGTDKVADHAGYAAAAAALGDRLRIIEQGNLGGSGGYARAQLETLEAGRSTYMMCMDDDVVCEPESIVRAVTFGDLCRRPTIVGGHMFSLYAKSRLHSFGEVVQRYRFWWQSPQSVHTDWDFGERNLRSSRWLHRRVDVDFNGWFMCLIPTRVLREIGLSLPLFIKWDDSEYGLRAQQAGFPTVTLPGAAVWHVPWSDKNDAVDWQAYFHQRNRFIAALLHSPYERGGRMVVESFNHQVKHLFGLEYSTAELRHRALEDVLAGPDQLHDSLGTTLPELRDMRQQYADARTSPDPEAFPEERRAKPPKRGQDPTQAKGRVGFYVSALTSAVRQVRAKRPLSDTYPEARLAAMDARWWIVSQFDSVVVSMPDGGSAAWRHRDPEEFRDLLRRTVDIHQRLHREWPRLAQQYRDQLAEITSPERWATTFHGGAGDR
ncbi:glycosyl transferase [Marmoricola sp. Leaf446]|uniref:glycosyltransferase n=1 Tax=Marmoricola sp. Leaf446 TaxID=1736379 RepID=UPI0006FCDB7A|nr:glycosyltransferase [Marmoricola sp. Leaf446]KQT89375.1 glycosyl transferase [Marmoricola sp. Leaf446]